MSIQNNYFASPIGILEIRATDEYLTAVLFVNTERNKAPVMEEPETSQSAHPLIKTCEAQLTEYFDGQRTVFDIPTYQQGSEFQQKVWSALKDIPYGRTISYLELSKRIGNVKAIRAVGTSNGNNNISIIVPCHRVIGSDGSLTGYGGDLWRKKWLLDHEARYANGVQTLF